MVNKLGLSTIEAEKRLKEYGLNEIKRKHKDNIIKIFLSQFTSPLIITLLVIAIVSVLIGYLPNQTPDYIDAILIVVIVFISGIASFFQEYNAKKSIEALQKMSIPFVQVIRDNKVNKILITKLTIGDVILLESGDVVPADGEVLESFGLKIDESILSGESVAIKKKKGDEIYMDTNVSVGSTKIKITKIGMQTKVGKIADKLQAIKDTKTSFEIEISNFSKKLFWLIGVIIVIIFIGSYTKYDLYTSLLTSISLAVAAIPEGLPAVVVLSLAIGAKAMYKNNALVRKLGVVESVGAIDIICSDKTGTITKNEMTVTKLYFNNKIFDTTNIKDDVEELLKGGLICNNVKTKGVINSNREYIGEQTEIGLIRIGEKLNIIPEKINEEYIRINEISFSSERKMMSVVVEDKKKGESNLHVYSKGAPEILLDKCNRILINGEIKELTEEDKNRILEQNSYFANDALRVLAFAHKQTTSINEHIENDLIFIGLQAMTDPPHPEIEGVLKSCALAGIRVIMITGDNSITAQAIARQVKLKTTGFLEGKDIDALSDQELNKELNRGINIFARTNPFHKLRILKLLQEKNRVLMTGDGVNDSLAIKQANVGIAMGLKGTTVAKEASDIVILDDNFSTIVKAVKEGRRIFDNIRKFINYLLVSNMAEVFVLFLSTMLFTLKEPILLPVQILWVNLLTDGLPALALGADPARENIMEEAPRDKNEPLINKKLTWLILTIGSKKTIILLITFFIILPLGEDLARTTLFTGFILYEFVRIATIRYQEKLSWLSNPWLLLALLVSVIFQIIIVYSPLNTFFHVVPLGIFEWTVLIIGVFIGYLLAILITKIITNMLDKKSNN